MFFDMNISSTKSKNLLLVSPLKQNLNKIRNWYRAPKLIMAPLSRGGVEDTKHEAKDTKNSRPRTALSRTDPLEAKDRKARGQGPRTQRGSDLQKKKIFAPKSKKRAVLESRIGHFRGLADFKAKDSKSCL